MIDAKYIQGHHKALVIGTGGGNDIVSAIPVAMYLQKYGLQTDIAGVLSAAAIHTYDGKYEREINYIGPNTKRYINGKIRPEVTFVDAHLPDVVQKLDIPIGSFYNLSTRFGTQNLTEKLQKLIKEKEYDLLVAVDVGGDILARGPRDKYILSPMMDFTTLNVIKNITIDKLLIEFGLGTDGELRPKDMDYIINNLKKKKIILDEKTISNNDVEVQQFRNIFDNIKHIRKGNTNVMTLKTLDAIDTQQDIRAPYRFRTQVGDKKWETPFDVVLSHKYFGKVYTMNIDALANSRQQTAFEHSNALEQYIKLKMLQPNRKTEMDMLYIWSDEDFTTPEMKGYCVHMVCPSKQIETKVRRDMLKTAVEGLQKNQSDMLVIPNDRGLNRSLYEADIPAVAADNFIVVYTDTDKQNQAEQLAEKIKSYQ